MVFNLLLGRLITPYYFTWKLTHLSSALFFNGQHQQQEEEVEDQQRKKQQRWLQDQSALAADIEAATDTEAEGAAEELKRAQWSGEYHQQLTYYLSTSLFLLNNLQHTHHHSHLRHSRSNNRLAQHCETKYLGTLSSP